MDRARRGAGVPNALPRISNFGFAPLEKNRFADHRGDAARLREAKLAQPETIKTDPWVRFTSFLAELHPVSTGHRP